MLSFDGYAEVTNPIQHLKHYQDKMAVYSHDVLPVSRVFPSSLKGVAFDKESPHNAILGRPWIHMISCHQLQQYPTSTGTTDIRGD